MSRDYKHTEPRSRSGALLAGLFVGLALGLAIALGVAFYLNRAANPFSSPRESREPAKTTAEPAGASAATATSPDKPPLAPTGIPGAPVPQEPGQPRFDFYRILPGTEQAATDQELRNRPPEPKATAQERFFLQAGAFQNAQDADNLKARLALMGMEASIQTASLGDKGTWHRVRLGPYDDADSLAKVRTRLSTAGIESAVIKVRDTKAP
ncbi:MAG: SPOR domain-containing protein [Pseudomonadota bacterium]|jgi:cell division protein FtsN